MALTLQSRWLRADDLEWVQTLIDTHFQDLFGQTLDGFCIGPNDAGKTMVLNLMGGLYTPDAGTVLLGTENVTALPPYRISRAGLLSGGEQQMLTLARGLLAAPHTLLLDEPSLGLAPMLPPRLPPS